METDFNKLVKILTAERKDGCRNRVVVGGLEKFLVVWSREASSTDRRGSVAKVRGRLQGYGQKSVAERTIAVQETLKALGATKRGRAPERHRSGKEAGLRLGLRLHAVRAAQLGEHLNHTVEMRKARTEPVDELIEHEFAIRHVVGRMLDLVGNPFQILDLHPTERLGRLSAGLGQGGIGRLPLMKFLGPLFVSGRHHSH